MCSSKPRIFAYDAIRLVAAFLVIFYHFHLVNLEFSPGFFYIPNFNRVFTNIAAMSVPLFFMVSGALTLGRSCGGRQVCRKTGRLIFVYFAWILITYSLNTAILGKFEILPLRSLLSGGQKPAAPLWYLRTLAILTLLSPVLNRWYRQHRKRLLGLVGLLLIYPFFWNYGLIVWAGCTGDPAVADGRTGLFTMYSLVYFVLGRLIADKIHGKWTWKKFLISGTVFLSGLALTTAEGMFWTRFQGRMFDSVNSSFPTPGALLMAASVFYGMCHLPADPGTRLSRGISAAGGNFLGIYVLHMSWIWLYRRLIGGTLPLPGAIGVTALVLVLSALTGALLKKIPVVRQLLRLSPARQKSGNQPGFLRPE